jgi:phosphoenolpyruvate carboxylase
MVRMPDQELRRDIRRVTSILGETLARTEGEDLLALVEDVRVHAKEDRLDQLPDFDLATITRLVRAFTAYFHLANITEQVHRGRVSQQDREDEGGWIEQAVARIGKAGVDAEVVTELMRHVTLRPVFTAHPT